jgi:hypothetical protein
MKASIVLCTALALAASPRAAERAIDKSIDVPATLAAANGASLKRCDKVA